MRARTMVMAQLREIDLPDFGIPDEQPVVPDAIYRDRLERFRQRAGERGYDRMVVYADREHSANLSYLTGFDPRFEEAILIVGDGADPLVLVGNECGGMAEAAPLPLRVELHQDLSLPGQPRDRSRPLAAILSEEGLSDGSRVGLIGWKEFRNRQM
ncbi:MAG: aminopeptidase P family N-terminal domain-containing protein, partial [Acidimicrobiales bacterium]